MMRYDPNYLSITHLILNRCGTAGICYKRGTSCGIKAYSGHGTDALARESGNLQWDTWKKTFFEQSGLSPQERTAYTDRVKKALGGSPVGDALIDIASNPLVWFTFLTTPAGATALKQGGRIFSSAINKSGKEFVGWAANNQSVRRAFGLLGLDTILMAASQCQPQKRSGS